ncbi:MAG: ABC transporter ATP-binding protein [Acetobacter sp.]|nr:ABC transporter ATP-binding protein [Acetobacter sp.]
MIKIQHISKQYDNKIALEDVTLTLRSGEVVALVGENGAGKSTLMRIICGYIPPSSGQVIIWEKDIERHRIEALLHIGYVPEISTLYGEMLVYDFLNWIATIWNLSSSSEAILSAAKKMQITDVLSQKIETLSKGYKKRVEIASAIMHCPDILILDEPTDGLDPNQKHYIRQFLKQYAKKNIVLLSTHVLEDTEDADRIIMLAHGKVIKDTKLADFKKISKHQNISEAFRILTEKTEIKK